MKATSFLSFATAYLLACVLLPTFAMAQKAEFSPQVFAAKISQPAISLVMEGQPKNVEEVLKGKIEKASGVKAKSYKGGIDVFAQAKVAEISATTVFDIYFRVEKPSKDDNTHAKVTMFLSLGNEANFVTQDKYAAEIANASAMLEKMVNEVRIYELQLAVEAQGKVIGTELNRQLDLEKSMASLEKKREEILREIETNRAAQEAQKGTIAAAQQKLAELQAALQAMGVAAPAAPGGK